jgi:hypothetical protein
MHEALCRPSGTTLDIVHAERRRPPITQRASGLGIIKTPRRKRNKTIEADKCRIPRDKS